MPKPEPAQREVIVGRFGGPWGVRGWLHLRSFTDPPANLLEYGPWLVEGPRGWKRSGWEPLEISEVQAHGDGFVAHVVGFDDRDEASARFRGVHIAVPPEALPKTSEDEFYWRDLMGLRAWTTAGVDLGTVQRVLETGANDVLVVREDADGSVGGKPKERLIPFVEQFVASVDLPAGRLVVDWDPDF